MFFVPVDNFNSGGGDLDYSIRQRKRKWQRLWWLRQVTEWVRWKMIIIQILAEALRTSLAQWLWQRRTEYQTVFSKPRSDVLFLLSQGHISSLSIRKYPLKSRLDNGHPSLLPNWCQYQSVFSKLSVTASRPYKISLPNQISNYSFLQIVNCRWPECLLGKTGLL